MKLQFEMTVHRLFYHRPIEDDENGTFGWADIITDGTVIHTEEFHGKVGSLMFRASQPYTRVVAVDVGSGGTRLEVRTRCAPGCIFEVDVGLFTEVP